MNTEPGVVLRDVMQSTGTTQTELSLLSGVHQPSISQFLSGKKKPSDDQLNRLLSCMGTQLEIVRRPTTPTLTRNERRSWLLHRQLSRHLRDETTLESWLPTLLRNIKRMREGGVRGYPHESNLDEWEQIIERRDINMMKRMLTGLSRHEIEMREVSPTSGLLPEDERLSIVLGERHRQQ